MPGLPALRRVGHKGADLIAPGNTRESFDAALRAGVDMIEFDVLPERTDGTRTGRLILAHDHEDAAGREPLTLEEGLAHLAGGSFAGVDLDVDLKTTGYEQDVADALREHGLLGRSLVSSQYMRSLVQMRAAEPALPLGWSVPRAKRDYTRSALYAVPAYAALRVIRRRLPGRAVFHLRGGRCDAVMCHWRVVSPALVRAVAGAGGELYVWTVDELARIRALEKLGVTGVITNDPRLFGPENMPR